jgi:lipopolysaccharide/colanic/teichoic acid biosynthesis glycosyltransferase
VSSFAIDRKEGAVGQPSLDRDSQSGVASSGAVPSTANSLDAPAPNAHSDDALLAPNSETTPESFRIVSPPTLALARRTTAYERLLKPVMDRVVSAVLLVVLSPLLLVVAVLVKLSLGSPILLLQKRVGRNGKVFELHKFRTMHADRREQSIGTAYNDGDRRQTHKHPNDPRLTLVGRTLRKWSLDELPQLLDVFAGKLSMVGPRPELVNIVDNYEPWQHARHAVKPGLTGLWQITARGDGEMHEHTDLDIEYAQKVTLRNDLKIMLLTVPAILAHKGY